MWNLLGFFLSGRHSIGSTQGFRRFSRGLNAKTEATGYLGDFDRVRGYPSKESLAEIRPLFGQKSGFLAPFWAP